MQHEPQLAVGPNDRSVGFSVVGRGRVLLQHSDLSMQWYIIVGRLLVNNAGRGPVAALTSVGNGALSWVDCIWFGWEGVLSQHCMGPHHSLVVFSLAGRGPVAALTSECNRKPSWAGRFESSGKGSCRSTDLSMQWGPIVGRSFLAGWKGVGSCRTTACNGLAQAWPG